MIKLSFLKLKAFRRLYFFLVAKSFLRQDLQKIVQTCIQYKKYLAYFDIISGLENHPVKEKGGPILSAFTY